MKKQVLFIVLAALLFATFTGYSATAFAKENNKIPPAAANTYGARVSASVDKLNGNKNNLNISVFTKDGVISAKISINNNASGTYAVGGYQVYVATYGNVKIEHCFITYAPPPVAPPVVVEPEPKPEPEPEPEPVHECKYAEAYRIEPTCTADGKIVYACACGESYEIALPAPGHNLVVGMTCTYDKEFSNNGLTGINRRYHVNVYLTFELSRGEYYTVTVAAGNIYRRSEGIVLNLVQSFALEVGCGTATVTVTVRANGSNYNNVFLQEVTAACRFEFTHIN